MTKEEIEKWLEAPRGAFITASQCVALETALRSQLKTCDNRLLAQVLRSELMHELPSLRPVLELARDEDIARWLLCPHWAALPMSVFPSPGAIRDASGRFELPTKDWMTIFELREYLSRYGLQGNGHDVEVATALGKAWMSLAEARCARWQYVSKVESVRKPPAAQYSQQRLYGLREVSK